MNSLILSALWVLGKIGGSDEHRVNVSQGDFKGNTPAG